MKTIIRVAATELKVLFYSPIAWFLIIFFLIQTGIAYFSVLDDLARMQDGGYKISVSVVSMIFQGNRGVFSTVMQNLYLYLPLLTMGLISRETSSGTIRLLYSSPIRMYEIVMGKFLSMMIMSLIFVGIVFFYIVSSYFTIQSPDTGLLLSSLLGLYLLFCAYSAIGLFMSSLTNYQIVAAVCTFVTILILNHIGSLWQHISFVRNLTYFLSMLGRTNKMLNGLITSKDLIYFFVIIYLFLGLTIYKLRAGMESKSVAVRIGRYLVVIFLTLTVGYISSIPQLVMYFDASRNKSNTITPVSQEILGHLNDGSLEVTAYANLLGNYFNNGAPEAYFRNIGRWEPYMRFKQDILLKTVMYYDTLNQRDVLKQYPGKSLEQVVAQVADTKDMKSTQFVGPAAVRKMVDLTNEPTYYTMQLKYKNKKTFLRVFTDNEQWPSEVEVSAAIKRLIKDKMPSIAFATGNLERSIHKYGDREYRVFTNTKSFRTSLVNQGFDVDTLSLDTQDIPGDLTVLVISDPKTELSKSVISKLQRYIDRGGNLLISGEPGKQSMLNPLIRQFGVQIREGIITQQSTDLQPELALPTVTGAGALLYPRLKGADADGAKVTMPGAAALSYADTAGYVIRPLLKTDSGSSWLKKRRLVSDSVSVKFAAEDGDELKSFATAVSLTRKINIKEQRIIITGDADYMANTELSRFNVRSANFVFNTGLFSWLSYGEFPINSFRPEPKDIQVFVDKNEVKVLKTIYVWGIPGLFIAFGAVLLIRRKRK